MKTAAASVMRASASGPPIWNRMRKTSAFLRKLSLNAEKNWVQNRGAKRRVISRDEDMAFPFRARACAGDLRDDNLGKTTIAPTAQWREAPANLIGSARLHSAGAGRGAAPHRHSRPSARITLVRCRPGSS